jgi:hypothetical protein
VGCIVLHFFITMVLGYLLLVAAYLFADSIPHGGSVDSYDQLYKLGRSPWFGFLGLALSGSIEFIASLALLGVARTRPYAWLVPLIGIGVSILVVVAAIVGFQPPPPDIGG